MSLPASVIALANASYEWRKIAACRDTDPELFFPVGTTGAALVQIAQAKEVCGDCPVHSAISSHFMIGEQHEYLVRSRERGGLA